MVQGVAMSGESIQSIDRMKSLRMISDRDINVLAPEGELLMMASEIEISGSRHVKVVSDKQLDINVGWNKDIKMTTSGGGVRSNNMLLDGSTMSSETFAHALTVASSQDISLEPGPGRDVIVSSGGFGVMTTGSTSIASRSISMSVAWNEDIQMMPRGGAVQAGALRMSGGRLASHDKLQGLLVNSVEDVSISAGHEKDIRMLGGTVMIASEKSTLISSQSIELATGWNQQITMDANGGFVSVGAVQVSGARVTTEDAMHGITMRSKEDVEIAAAADSDVRVSGGSISLMANDAVNIMGASISLASQWGGNIEVSPVGGSMMLDSLRLSGAEMSSVDRLGGMTVRSEEEDVQIAAGRAVSVRGERVQMVGERQMQVTGGQVQLSATGYNENVQVQTVGGALAVGALGISGSTVASTDVMSGLRMRSAEDVQIAAGAGQDVRLSGADVVILSDRSTRVEARSIELSTGWNGDVAMNNAGGALATGQLRFSGSGVASGDSMRGFSMGSARDIELLPGVGRDVIVSSGGFGVMTTGSTSIASRSISMSVAWNEDIQMMPRGGAVQAGALRMSGGRLASHDKLQGLLVNSVEDVSISAGHEKDIRMLGGTVMIASEKSTLISSQSIELATGWNQQITMDANGGFVSVGAVQVSGARVTTEDAMHGITMRSKEDVEIAAAADSDVRVSGGSISLMANDAVNIMGASISLASQWGGNIEVSPVGGSMMLDSLRLSGAEMSSVDRLGGMTVRSEEEDVQIAAGRAVSVRGERVQMVGERQMQVTGGQVQLSATGYNENVQVQTVGGALAVGALGISGSTVASTDVMSGLRMRSAEDVQIAAGAGQDVRLSGADVVILSDRSTRVEARSIELATGWNGDVAMNNAGGALATGQLRFSGSGVASGDSMRGFSMGSARDIELLPGVGRDVIVSSGGFGVMTTGSTSIASRSISMSVAWNEDIQMMPRGGAVQAGALRMSGGRLASHDKLQGLLVNSVEDVSISAGHEKDIRMLGGTVMIASEKSTLISSQSIELATGWNQQITMDANGGFVSVGAVQVSGARVTTEDAMHGITMRSKEDVEIAAAADSDVRVSGGSISLMANDAVNIMGASISLASQWGGNIEVSPVGGSMMLDSLRLSGAEMSSVDRLGGMTVRSEEEDVQIAAGRAVSVRGERVQMVGERQMQVTGGQVQLSATGYNENVQVQTVGGALAVGALGISGSTVASTDVMSGLRMRSAEDVQIAAGAGQDVRLSGADVVILSDRSTRVEARSIELATGWNGDVAMNNAGGALATGQLRFSGSGVASGDSMRGFSMGSARDIELLPGVGRDVIVSSGGFGVMTTGSTSIASRSISMSVAWNEDIQMMPRGGAVQAGALRMSGGRLASHDKLQGLLVNSVEDVSISAGHEKDIRMLGGTVMIASEKSTLISSQSIELATGWNQQITMDANGGFVSVGAVQVSGARVTTEDAMHGITLRSKEDVEIAAAADSDVRVSGGSISLMANDAVNIMGASISLASQWGGNIEVSPVGGSMMLDSLRLSGAEMSSVDRLGGMTVRSEEEDVQIAAGRAVSVRGERVQMVGERQMQVTGGQVQLSATGYNENVQVQTVGGALAVGALGISGSTVASTDVMSGLRMRSAEDVQIAAGAGQDVRLSGADVVILSDRSTRVEARSIELATGWNGDVAMNNAGGALATGQLRFSGSGVASGDSMRGFSMGSARDIELLPGVGRDVIVSSGGFGVMTTGSTSIASRSISMSVAWNEDIQMMPRGGAVQAGALRMSGGRLASHDKLQGLLVNSVEDVSISAGHEKDIRMLGGTVMIASEKSTLISSQSIELATGWNQQITMDANGGFVSVGAVQVSGARVTTEDAMHGITMRSKEDVEIAAAADSDVRVSGGSISLMANDAVNIMGASISLASQWGGNIEVSPVGGSMMLDSLRLSGAEMSSVDRLGGMTVRSEEEDVQIAAGRAVSVRGERVQMVGERQMQVTGGQVQLSATGYNENVQVQTVGGALAVGALGISGSTVASTDVMSGLRMRSAEDVHLQSDFRHESLSR